MSKKTALKLSSKSPSDLEGTQCKECLRKEAIEDGFRCTVLNNFYFTEEKPSETCWAFNSDVSLEINILQQANKYVKDKTGVSKPIENKLEELRRIASKQFKEDLKGIYLEEVHRGKRGGGDRQDRTHKLFPESRMRDNRYKPAWGQDD